MLRLLTPLLVLCGCTFARAVEFENITQDGKHYTVCRVDLRKEKLHLFLRDDQGQPLKSFIGIESWLAPQRKQLIFGMNAGMYHAGLIPVGWFVEGGRELSPLNSSNGVGNFFLKPNGVFIVTRQGARILETSQAAALHEPVELATQSGPLLVREGKIHPAFQPQSESRLFRNGVGIVSAQEPVFVISEDPVNFYEFATLFRDALHCPDALFFDGTICSLYAPPLHRNDRKIDLGPMIGITAPVSKP